MKMIDYYKSLIITAKGLHEDNPEKGYDKLIKFYKEEIERLKNTNRN